MILLVMLAFHITPFMLVLYALTLGALVWEFYEAFYMVIVGRWRLSAYAASVVVLGLGLFLFFKFSPIDPMPSVVACYPYREIPIIDLTVDNNRVFGTVTERHAFGCTFFYYESRGD